MPLHLGYFSFNSANNSFTEMYVSLRSKLISEMSFISFFNLGNSLNDDIGLASFRMISILFRASCKLSRAILAFLKFNFIFSSVAKDLICFRFLFIPNTSWSDFMSNFEYPWFGIVLI